MTDYFVEQLRDVRSDVASLKRDRVTYRSATVTAVNAVASTFDATVSGAGSLSGIPAERAFLPAVGDVVRLSLAGATPVYQPHRIGEGAVGPVELDDEVTDSIQTALDAANGKNKIYVGPLPASPGTPGTTVNDAWWQIVDSVLIGSWRWNGTAWEPHKFGDAVFDTISVAKLTSGQIAAGVSITIGSPLSDHTVIDDEKIAFQAVTPEGVPYEVTRYGRDAGAADAAGNMVWQIDEGGYATLQGASIAGDPLIMGIPFSEYLSERGSGFHAGAGEGRLTDPAATPAGGGETGLYEAAIELEGNHLYKIETSNIWVRPDATATRIDVNLRYEVSVDPAVDPPAVTTASKLFTRWPQDISGGIGHGAILNRVYRPLQYAHFRFLLTLSSTGGSAWIEMGSGNHTDPVLGTIMEPEAVQLIVSEMGGLPWTNRAVANGGSSGGVTPAPKKRYTYTYYPHWTRRFLGNGSVHSDGADAVQGQTPYYASNGDQASQIGDFRRDYTGPALASDLAGATIEKFEVYLYASHWHYNGGGTAVLRYHNNTSPGSRNNYAGDTRVGGWARSQGRWVNVGTSWGALFRDGGAKGIQVGPAGSTDPIYYGTFDGHAGGHRPAIRATFTK